MPAWNNDDDVTATFVEQKRVNLLAKKYIIRLHRDNILFSREEILEFKSNSSTRLTSKTDWSRWFILRNRIWFWWLRSRWCRCARVPRLLGTIRFAGCPFTKINTLESEKGRKNGATKLEKSQPIFGFPLSKKTSSPPSPSLKFFPSRTDQFSIHLFTCRQSLWVSSTSEMSSFSFIKDKLFL